MGTGAEENGEGWIATVRAHRRGLQILDSKMKKWRKKLRPVRSTESINSKGGGGGYEILMGLPWQNVEGRRRMQRRSDYFFRAVDWSWSWGNKKKKNLKGRVKRKGGL